jgi:hypothetical protein
MGNVCNMHGVEGSKRERGEFLAVLVEYSEGRRTLARPKYH